MIYEILKYSLLTYAALMGFCLILYIPRIFCWFGSIRPQKHFTNSVTNKITIIIPARNESIIIRGLLDCLKNQEYPKESYDVILVVKDALDPTITIAKEYGYSVVVDPYQNCKGDALDCCFKKLLSEKNSSDAYLVIDADCWVDPNCLREFNNAMASGKDIITGKKIVKNYYSKNKKARPLSALCNGMIWSLIDTLGNRFKSDHNIPTMTITCGILFRRKVIERLKGFPYNKTMTEDMELMFSTPIYGFTTYYTSYALIYMEEATSLKMSNYRRTRWIGGYVAAKRLYGDQLADILLSPKELMQRYYLNGMYNAFWIYGITAVYMFISIISFGCLLVLHDPHAINALYNALIAFGFAYTTLQAMTLFVMIADHKYMPCSIWTKLALVFVHPLYYMGYLKISFKALFGRKEDDWKTIERAPALEKK